MMPDDKQQQFRKHQLNVQEQQLLKKTPRCYKTRHRRKGSVFARVPGEEGWVSG